MLEWKSMQILYILELAEIPHVSGGTTLEGFVVKRELLKYMYVQINTGNKKCEDYLSVGAEFYERIREYCKNKSFIIFKRRENFMRDGLKNIKTGV